MNANEPSAAIYVRNLHAHLGDQRFCNLGWNNPANNATFTGKGLDPADVRREARKMMRSIAAYNEAH